VFEKEIPKIGSSAISEIRLQRRKYIAIAIESVGSIFSDFEFIIVDDCSTDASWEIIQKYSKQDRRIVALRNEVNLKGCNTLNKGLKLAKGKYIARMDNDDRCYPDRFKKQFNFMESHPEVGFLITKLEEKYLDIVRFHIRLS
jgi:glycosyltransferase involved in cell wall biosynthesis